MGLADLCGRQVEAPERPVLGVGEGFDATVRGEPRQGESLRVHQFDLLPHEFGRQVERDGGSRAG